MKKINSEYIIIAGCSRFGINIASALGTVGLYVGITSPTAPSLILWTKIIGMLFGRLEIWVIFIAIFKITKKLLQNNFYFVVAFLRLLDKKVKKI